MKILSVSLQNFASYKSLNFNFQNQGLTLIHGPTGAGKSTLCDAIPWILFGTTAKGGSVSEVLAWNADGPTEGFVQFEIAGGTGSVVRKRNPNDLYFGYSSPVKGTGHDCRGKDLNDTQKLINGLLGMDADLYLAGAYYHEFSQTAQFFQTSAKNRRSICEQMVDLSLSVTLQEKVSERRKQIKLDISKLETELDKAKYKLEHLKTQAEKQLQNMQNWAVRKQDRIKELYTKFNGFEDVKAKRIENLQEAYTKEIARLRTTSVCTECGSPKAPNPTADNVYMKRSLLTERKSENPYFEQILAVEAETNPFNLDVSENKIEIELLEVFLRSNSQNSSLLKQDLDDIELLSDTVGIFRAELIANAVSSLEASTNKLLTDHFDAEIRVSFSVEDADKLDVSIFKDGNSCAYTQLSKGQRCLLKLCFGISVMKEIATHHAIKFHQIFFDESLDGLDSDFKLKALGLLQSLELEYESIFLVEHSSEIKASCSNSYYIQLIDGNSVLNEKA